MLLLTKFRGLNSSNVDIDYWFLEGDMGDPSASRSTLILLQHDTEEGDLQYQHIVEEFGWVFEATSSSKVARRTMISSSLTSENRPDWIVPPFSIWSVSIRLMFTFVYRVFTSDRCWRSLSKIARWFDARKIRSGINAENGWTRSSLLRWPSNSSIWCRTSKKIYRKRIRSIDILSLLQTSDF